MYTNVALYACLILIQFGIERIHGFGCCVEEERRFPKRNWVPAILYMHALPKDPYAKPWPKSVIRAIRRRPTSAQKLIDEFCGKESCQLASKNIQSLADVKFPANITRIDLSNNSLTSLANVQFPPLLEELRVNGNQLTFSEKTNLSHLNALTDLSLMNNKITALSAISFPKNLQMLSVRGNAISSQQFYEADFSDLQSLFYVDFGANNLSSMNGNIAAKFAKSIEVLDFDNNQISEMVMAKIPKSLKLLNLANNRLDYIEIENIEDFPVKNCSLKVEMYGNPMRARIDEDYMHLIGAPGIEPDIPQYTDNDGLMQEGSRHASVSFATPYRSRFLSPPQNEQATPAKLRNDMTYSPRTPGLHSVLKGE